MIIFQAQLNCFPSSLQEGVEVFRLRVATSQARDRGDMIALFVPFDDNGEFAGMLHRAILAREGKALTTRPRSAFAEPR